jgi:hypothetical protein
MPRRRKGDDMVGAVEGSRRWVAVALAAASLASVLGGCGVPPAPTDPDRGPLLCADGPVDLGPGAIMEAIAPDGSAVVLGRLDPAAPGTFRYDLIDTTTGLTWEMFAAPSASDGADVVVDRTGDRAVSVDYPSSAGGERPVRLHDRRTRTTTATPAALFGWESFDAVSDDLRFAVVLGGDWLDPDHTRVDLVTGARTPLPSHSSPGWWNADYSPDATLVVQSSGTGTARQVRVRSTVTGEVVRDFGVLTYESGAFAELAFVDDDTVLIDGARPADEGSGAVTGDDAVLARVSTGATTRIDPGVQGAAVEASSADGSRLVYRTPAPGAELRVAVAGVHRSLGASRGLRVEQDPVVLLTGEPGGTVALHCI